MWVADIAFGFCLNVDMFLFSDMFGDDCVKFTDDKNFSVTVDGVTATIESETRVSMRSGRSLAF